MDHDMCWKEEHFVALNSNGESFTRILPFHLRTGLYISYQACEVVMAE